MNIPTAHIKKFLKNGEISRIADNYDENKDDNNRVLYTFYNTAFSENIDVTGNPLKLSQTKLMYAIDNCCHNGFFRLSANNNMKFLIENIESIFVAHKYSYQEIVPLIEAMHNEGNLNIKEQFKDVETFNRLIHVSASDEFLKYVIDNSQDINRMENKIAIICGMITKPEILQIMIDKGFDIQSKHDKNKFKMNILFYLSFYNHNYQKLKVVIKYFGNIESIKIDEELQNDIISDVCNKNNNRILNFVGLDIIELLSTLENFDDFVKNNYFFLMKVLSEDAIEFIRRY